MDFPDLHGERINLIEISMEGLQDMHEYSKMSELYRYMEFGQHHRLEDTKRYLNKLIQRSSHETGHYWFIQLKATQKIIGTFGLLEIDRRKGSAEIGYGLSPHYWGQGYFHECLVLVLQYLFQSLGFHRAWSKTQIDNIPSIKALSKVGFRREGVLRHYYLSMKDRVRSDAVIMGLLSHEFKGHL